MTIDWTNPKAKISKHFTVKEACWLPSWSAMHQPSDQEKVNILKMAETMDKIRELVNAPINIHCWIRPGKANCQVDLAKVQWSKDPTTKKAQEAAVAALDYNTFVKGARASRHRTGEATDWSAVGMKCDDVRDKLKPKLEEFGIRVEDLPGSSWVHTDIGQPFNGVRFFKP